eukprot:TRINITY_DN43536_c0_g1_i1.p1 TRINITY_DN43536_c0_g1~~TRINITY_DN43536_c0_g1_i1.p1  ORF type:complete len:323 (-),score=35.59 TRINITY_DN43536_c0_g1_i1:108-1076(-)
MAAVNGVGGDVDRDREGCRATDKPTSLRCNSVSAGWNGTSLSERAWKRYLEFRAENGHKCPDCWLLRDFCCCAAVEIAKTQSGAAFRPRVLLVMHPTELNDRRGSNTAKLLLQFGAELCVWGYEEHEQRVANALSSSLLDTSLPNEGSATSSVVLFPSEDAVDATELSRDLSQDSLKNIVVLDGGWKEATKMNRRIDPRVTRVRVSSAALSDYKVTRKYNDANTPERVQTAAAFTALMAELKEDIACVRGLQDGLQAFMNAFERQCEYSGVFLAMQMGGEEACRNREGVGRRRFRNRLEGDAQSFERVGTSAITENDEKGAA